MSLMTICSTSHRQRGACLLLLVAGAVLACVSLYFVKSDIVILFSFHCVLAAVCKLSIFLSFFLFVIAEDCDAYTTLLSSVQVMIALRFYTTGTF